jgi:integrase
MGVIGFNASPGGCGAPPTRRPLRGFGALFCSLNNSFPNSHPSNPEQNMAKTHSKTVSPATRPKNADLRTREYLTDDEVQRLAEAAKANRHGHRDATMILVAYRHGLRASELTDLRWDQIEFTSATLHVRRSSKAHRAHMRSSVTNCARSARFIANKNQSLHLFSRQNAARHSRRRALQE